MELPIEFVDLGPFSMEYCLSGPENQPVLAFVHGLSADLRQFEGQMAYFKDQYRILLLSLRGHGSSGCPEPAGRDDFTLSAMAEDVVALLNYLKLPAVHWVGNSMGGLVGYELLRDFGDRLLSLTTFGTTAELHFGPVVVKMLDFFKEAFIKLKGYEGFARFSGRASSKIPRVRDEVTTMILAASREAVRYAHMNIGKYNYLDALATVEIPLLLIRAEYDREINKSLRSTTAMLDRLDNAAVIDLPGAGHFANLDQPDRFNLILKKWLAGK